MAVTMMTGRSGPRRNCRRMVCSTSMPLMSGIITVEQGRGRPARRRPCAAPSAPPLAVRTVIAAIAPGGREQHVTIHFAVIDHEQAGGRPAATALQCHPAGARRTAGDLPAHLIGGGIAWRQAPPRARPPRHGASIKPCKRSRAASPMRLRSPDEIVEGRASGRPPPPASRCTR